MGNLRVWLLTFAIILCLIGAALASAFVPMAQDYRAIPVSNRASAYTLGVRLALTSENLHEIWAGKTPRVLFQTREHDMNNKYVWQESQIVRVGDCLDLYAKKPGEIEMKEQPRLPECDKTHKIKPQADRFQFKVGDDRELSIRVTDKAPESPLRIAHGALFGVQGEILTGLEYQYATKFQLEFEADALGPADVGPEQPPSAARTSKADESCDDARLVRPRGYWLMQRLPPVPARLCRYRSKNGRVLALVHYRSGPLQHMRFTDVVMCRAMLGQMTTLTPPVDAAGCIGGRWGEPAPQDVNVVLFDTTPQTYVALFR